MKQILRLLYIVLVLLVITNSLLMAQNIQSQKPRLGAGTQESPFQISSAEELYWFANYINEDKRNITACATLTSNIDLNPGFQFSYQGYSGPGIPIKWRPIGNYYEYWNLDLQEAYQNIYSGTFDGNGYIIRGLYIENRNGSIENQGLFGALGESGIVKNVQLENSYIYHYAQKQMGNQPICIAGICGLNLGGSIIDCNTNINIEFDYGERSYDNRVGGICGRNEKGEIRNCKAHNNIILNNCGAGTTVGGICADNIGRIKDCENAGSISAKKGDTSFLGGICGFNSYDDIDGTGIISNCYNTGSITCWGNDSEMGGICGVNVGFMIENCYNIGNLSFHGNKYAKIGGIIGSNSGKITNCYNIGTIFATGENNGIGGICGDSSEGDILINCFNAGKLDVNEDQSNKTGGICGRGEYAKLKNCIYLNGTADVGIGYRRNDSEPITTTAKNARDFVEEMNDCDNGFTLNNGWETSAHYRDGIIKFPTLGGEVVIPILKISDIPSSIEIINKNTPQIHIRNGNIVVFTPQREQVYIFNIKGVIVSSQQQQGVYSYPKLPKGIYIVRVGKQSLKVSIN